MQKNSSDTYNLLGQIFFSNSFTNWLRSEWYQRGLFSQILVFSSKKFRRTLLPWKLFVRVVCSLNIAWSYQFSGLILYCSQLGEYIHTLWCKVLQGESVFMRSKVFSRNNVALLPRGFQGNMNYWSEEEVCELVFHFTHEKV